MPRSDTRQREREQAIRRILRSRTVRTQQDLLARLRHQGFEVTQTSVSRDLQRMGIRKEDGHYRLPREASDAPPGTQALDSFQWVRSVAAAGPYLLVLKTPAGRAAAVGIALDEAGWPGMVGCVAGDDTVLVAVASRRDQVQVSRMLERVRGGEKP